MTTDEQAEWNYWYHERLGFLCEDREPTEEQEKIAREVADAAVARMSGALLI